VKNYVIILNLSADIGENLLGQESYSMDVIIGKSVTWFELPHVILYIDKQTRIAAISRDNPKKFWNFVC
jgi:hypothetical protein